MHVLMLNHVFAPTLMSLCPYLCEPLLLAAANGYIGRGCVYSGSRFPAIRLQYRSDQRTPEGIPPFEHRNTDSSPDKTSVKFPVNAFREH